MLTSLQLRLTSNSRYTVMQRSAVGPNCAVGKMRCAREMIFSFSSHVHSIHVYNSFTLVTALRRYLSIPYHQSSCTAFAFFPSTPPLPTEDHQYCKAHGTTTEGHCRRSTQLSAHITPSTSNHIQDIDCGTSKQSSAPCFWGWGVH